MDPLTIALIVGAPMLFNLIGQWAASGDNEKAEQYMQAASQAFNIPLPEVQKMVAQKVRDTNLGNVRADPTLRAAQMKGLQGFEDIATAGGMDPIFRQQMEAAQQQTSGAAQARRQSILSGEAQRGTMGSGRALAAQLQGAQQAAQGEQAAGLTAAAAGQQRALEGLRGMAGLGGDIRAQDYSEAARAAEAQDRIDALNAAYAQQAQDYNLNEPWRRFDAQRSLAAGRSGALGNLAGYYGQRGARTQQAWGDVGQAAGAGAALYGQYGGGGMGMDMPSYGYGGDVAPIQRGGYSYGPSGGMADMNPARRRGY